MVDEGSIALVAICLIAKGQTRGGGAELNAHAGRCLALAVANLNDNEQAVKAEIERRKPSHENQET